MASYRLTDGKLDKTDEKRNDEEQNENPTGYRSMKDITHRFAHQNRQIEAPHIKSQIFYALYFIHKLRQESATQ